MNDSKYGWDKPDNNTLRLTLLHTPKTKKNYAYQDRQDFGHHTFTYSLVGHVGALDVVQTRENAELLNQRIKAFVVGKHRGELGKSYSLAFSDNRNVLIKALKKAEVQMNMWYACMKLQASRRRKPRLSLPTTLWLL